jgi:DMSO reductase anchor subunit
MNARDWALITFTILTQMSVGSFLVLGIVHYYANRKAGMKEADRLSDYYWRLLSSLGWRW